MAKKNTVQDLEARIQKQIEKMATQLAQKKAQEMQEQSIRARLDGNRKRKLRAEKIHKLGAMVEKMGLSELDDDLFLGLLSGMNNKLKNSDQAFIDTVKEKGKPFLIVGVKLEKPTGVN